MPWSTTLTIVCRIAERMRLEPALPSTTSTSPSRSTAVGAIIEGIRRPRVAGAGVQAREREREQRAAGRRRRVGQDLAAAVADARGLAGDGVEVGEVGGRERPAVLGDPGDRGLCEIAGVERRGALGAEA